MVPAVALALYALSRNGPGTTAPPAAAAVPSIAVLPFVDMTEARDQGYFADGVAEEILNRLSKAGTMRVISRTSSFSLRGDEMGIPEIAARLDVSHVLEGSVRRSGHQIRITAQLIDASRNSRVWSETYDRGIGELFAVQDEIAGRWPGRWKSGSWGIRSAPALRRTAKPTRSTSRAGSCTSGARRVTSPSPSSISKKRWRSTRTSPGHGRRCPAPTD
jgi:TolB-like protein